MKGIDHAHDVYVEHFLKYLQIVRHPRQRPARNTGVGNHDIGNTKPADKIIRRVLQRGRVAYVQRVDGRSRFKFIGKALEEISATFDQVEAILADGREFLVGDRLTMADIGFAAMAMPAVWPPEFSGGTPDLDQLPSALRDEILKLRTRPAGQFALKMYRKYRQQSAKKHKN